MSGLRRPNLAAALIYALVAVVMFGPGLIPGRTLSNSDQLLLEYPWKGADPHDFPRASVPPEESDDAVTQFRPFLRYASDHLFDPPLWNPHISNGRPFLANAQSAVLSLFSLPGYVLPVDVALGWIAVLKLWVAAMGMFLLARALAMRFGGALLAGVVYGFSFWLVTWVAYPHASVWAWIPWLLLLTDRLVRRPDLVNASGLAALTGLVFVSGHPEESFRALFVTVAFFALRVAQARALRGPLLAFAGALVGGALLAAAVVLPVAELILNSADLDQRSGAGIDAHLPTKWLLGVLMPDYWGRATGTLLEPFQYSRAFYVGALPLLLAVAAMALRRNAERIAIAAFGGVSLAVVVGIPPFLQILSRLPVFSTGHNNRLAIYWVLCLALLAGWGLDDLTERAAQASRQAGRRTIPIIGAVLLAIPIVFVATAVASLDHAAGALKVAAGVTDPPWPLDDHPEARDIVRLASLDVWIVFGGAAFTLVALRLRGRVQAGPFVALAVLLVVADLLRAGIGFNPAIDRDDANPSATPAIRVLERDRSARYVSQSLVDTPPNVIPMRFGLRDARGYDVPIIERYDRLWRTQLEPECPTQTASSLGPYCLRLFLANVTPTALNTLRTLGVSAILQPPTAPPLTLPGTVLAYDGPDARIYRIEGTSRAFVAGAQQVVDGKDQALAAVTRPRFFDRAVAVTERRLAGVAEVSGSAQAPLGPARIVTDEAERVVVRARSSKPGVLVLTDTYYPGWKAKVDGRETDVEQVNYVLRGVPIGAGAHVVEFTYEPLAWRIGWITSVLALLGLGVAVGVGRRRRSERSSH
jgi:hypothetical protein